MTLQEIAERLRAEFPKHYTSFKLGAGHHGSCNRIVCSLKLYHELLPHGGVECTSLDDGIRQVRRELALRSEEASAIIGLTEAPEADAPAPEAPAAEPVPATTPDF